MRLATKQCKQVLAVFLLACMCVLSIPAVARAEEEYYATWDAYQTGTGLQNATWNDVVDAMDAVLDNAVSLFESGDLKAAYNGVNDAYYGYYETTGFERVAMGYISGARKSEMELQFSAANP